MVRIYYVGLYRHGRTAVIQYTQNRDCLNCELIEYYGERATTKERAKSMLKNPKIRQQVLAELREAYPKQNFKSVRIA